MTNEGRARRTSRFSSASRSTRRFHPSRTKVSGAFPSRINRKTVRTPARTLTVQLRAWGATTARALFKMLIAVFARELLVWASPLI